MSELPITTLDNAIAAEKGRLMAARAMAEHPDQRKRVEDVYGVEYCRRRYREVYYSGFGKLLDRIRFW